MTKQHSKVLIAGIVLASLVLPVFAFAQDADGANLRARPAVGGTGETRLNFCTALETIASRHATALSERAARQSAFRTERSTKLNERFQDRDTNRVGNRYDWDNKRAEWKAKLTERAGSDPVKLAAVDTYIAAVDAAVAKRRTAVDGAVSAYRTAIDADIKARQSAVDGALAQFRTATDAAMTKAKEDCATGVAPATARGSYVTAMRAAREALVGMLKALDKRTAALRSLGEARKAVVEAAVVEFNAAMKTAGYNLKENVK